MRAQRKRQWPLLPLPTKRGNRQLPQRRGLAKRVINIAKGTEPLSKSATWGSPGQSGRMEDFQRDVIRELERITTRLEILRVINRKFYIFCVNAASAAGGQGHSTGSAEQTRIPQQYHVHPLVPPRLTRLPKVSRSLPVVHRSCTHTTRENEYFYSCPSFHPETGLAHLSNLKHQHPHTFPVLPQCSLCGLTTVIKKCAGKAFPTSARGAARGYACSGPKRQGFRRDSLCFFAGKDRSQELTYKQCK